MTNKHTERGTNTRQSNDSQQSLWATARRNGLRIVLANIVLATAAQRSLTVSSKSSKPATYGTKITKGKWQGKRMLIEPYITVSTHITAPPHSVHDMNNINWLYLTTALS